MKIKVKPISLTRLLLLFVLLVIGCLPLIASLAHFIPPSISTIFQWLGLGMPFLLLLNVLALVCCVYKRSKYSFIPLVSLVFCFFYYTPLIFQRNSEDLPRTEKLKVATYNVHGFASGYGFSTVHNVAEFSIENDLDVLSLQEVPSWYNDKSLLEEFSSMKYIATSTNPHGGGRLIILSKYPLSEIETLSVEERAHLALTAVLNYNQKKVQLVNCHLQTTSWNQLKEHDYLTSFGLIYKTMSDNFVKRANQAREVRKIIDSATYPVIVVGDFNAPAVSYSYNTVLGNLKDSFREAGNGYSYTYRYLKKFFRIDYIFFAGEAFDAYNYRTAELDYSDHLPVLVDFVLK